MIEAPHGDAGPHATMHFWTPQNFADVTAGRWLTPPTGAAPLRGVSTDSRHIEPGQVFIALRGEKFDGHDYLAAVAKTGAGLLVVSDEGKARDIGPAGPAVLLVPDTLLALQQLASAYRDVLGQRGCKVIAVAGSNGKTTTRNLIHTILSAKFRGTQSPKSFNNHIGVPLTLLGASLPSAPGSAGGLPANGHKNPPAEPGALGKDDFVVVEVGTNHPGEIENLSKIVRPDVAVVTSIGHEHMEFFKTLDGVAAEEAQILRFIRPDGLAVLPAYLQLDRLVINNDSHFLDAHLGLIPQGVRLIRFGTHDGGNLNVSMHTADIDRFPLRFVLDGTEFHVPLMGLHNIANALAAILVGRWLGVVDTDAAVALSHATGVPMRMEVRKYGSGDDALTVINDAYNANPSSTIEAINALGFHEIDWPGQRRVLILGDMLELGEEGPDLHRKVARSVGRFDPSRHQMEKGSIHHVVLIGQLSMFVAEVLNRMWPPKHVTMFPAWDDSIPDKVADLLQPGDVVLLKGSRGMKLERILPAVEMRFGKQLETAKRE